MYPRHLNLNVKEHRRNNGHSTVDNETEIIPNMRKRGYSKIKFLK